MLKKGDIYLLIGLLLVSAFWFGSYKFSSGEKDGAHRIALIKQNDKLIKRVDLELVQEPERISVQGEYSEIILVEKGRIRFEDANCPDKVCVRTGWLEQKGDFAACIPNWTTIKIEGENSKVDGVSY